MNLVCTTSISEYCCTRESCATHKGAFVTNMKHSCRKSFGCREGYRPSSGSNACSTTTYRHVIPVCGSANPSFCFGRVLLLIRRTSGKPVDMKKNQVTISYLVSSFQLICQLDFFDRKYLTSDSLTPFLGGDGELTAKFLTFCLTTHCKKLS